VPSGREKVFANVVSIAELPNGDISYIASYADTGHIYFHRTTKVINIIADDIGRLKKVLKYQNSQPPLFAASAAETGNGGRVVLMDNTDAPLMMHINAEGEIDWQKAYPLVGRSQETRSVLATPEGFYCFSFTHNGGSTDLSLLKTDIEGNAACVQAPFALNMSDITNDFNGQTVDVTIDLTPARWYNIIALSMNDYDLAAETVCRKTCCEDKITTEQKVDLCNVTSYKLPNGDVVTAAGTYAITHKTAKGCDSIVYYNVQFSQHPVVNLGNSTCFNGADSLVLKTVAGYGSYKWSSSNVNAPSITIRTTGDYWVSVTNGCGTKTDTISVFEKCEFDIYVPSAFTPNGDQRNDVFKIPPLNKNKLVKLIIFNRYGQMVFETSDVTKGWDGTFNNKLQDPGTFVYTLIMETLNGKRVTKRGTVALIR
jgi:gliding motility-associated-like protein